MITLHAIWYENIGWYFYLLRGGAVAARQSHKLEVVGSSPTLRNTTSFTYLLIDDFMINLIFPCLPVKVGKGFLFWKYG